VRVGVSGYYGHQNAGDEAILEAIVQEIKARGHEPIIFSAAPHQTEARYGVKAVAARHPWMLWSALGQIDLLLSGGGGLLQDRTSARSLWYYLMVIQLARYRGKPVFIFNQSLGPLSAQGEMRVRRALREVPVIVRDPDSLAYADRLGLQAELGADCALLLQAPPVPREEDLVVIVPRAGVPGANRTLKAAAERLRSQGLEVLVLGMQPGQDDGAVEEFHGFTRKLAWDPKRVLYLLAQAGYVLSIRLHGLILAAAAKTPFAGISYDPKVIGFCREAGALCLESPGSPGPLVEAAEQRRPPDWSAIEAMKARVRGSFDLVLTPRPASPHTSKRS